MIHKVPLMILKCLVECSYIQNTYILYLLIQTIKAASNYWSRTFTYKCCFLSVASLHQKEIQAVLCIILNMFSFGT